MTLIVFRTLKSSFFLRFYVQMLSSWHWTQQSSKNYFRIVTEWFEVARSGEFTNISKVNVDLVQWID